MNQSPLKMLLCTSKFVLPFNYCYFRHKSVPGRKGRIKYMGNTKHQYFEKKKKETLRDTYYYGISFEPRKKNCLWFC